MQVPGSATAGIAPRSEHRLLVIDDNPAIHDDFRKVLGSASLVQSALRAAESSLFGSKNPWLADSAFEIDCASQGRDGLALVQKALAEGRPYSLAFVDGRMPPGWDGIETIVHLWREQPDLQVVLCTAYSDYSWSQIRRVLGETDSMVILKKPFDNVEVLQLAYTLTKKWTLSRQVRTRLEDLDRLVQERTRQTLEARALLDAAVAQSPAGILIADAPNVTIRWANAAALEARSRTDLPAIGIELDQITQQWQPFRPDGSPYAARELPLTRAILRGESTVNEEIILRDAAGADRWISVNAAPVHDANGRIAAGIVIFNDITEAKNSEAEKEQLRTQFVQAQKMESIGRLAGGVAHDFNNMLQVIQGFVELALLKLPGAGGPKAELLEIQKAAERSSNLTRQLLAYSRQQAASPEVIDLNLAVSAMVNLLVRMIGGDIQLVWQPGAGLWPVRMDPSQIDQVLANLTVNARDAIGGAGRCTIETANITVGDTAASRRPGIPAGEYVALSVRDTGCGITEEVRKHLFEPFFTTKALGEGTGLGLATVHGIVTQNRGFIEVDSQPGHGATFRILLPRSLAQPTTSAPEPLQNLLAPGTETLLLVEDEAQVLELSQIALTRHGYKVHIAHSAAAALEVATRVQPIHLLVTDVVMPEMNGRELRDKLRATYPKLKCLFISGYTADAIGDRGVLEEGVHFLQKPFSLQSLLVMVRKCLEQPVSDL